MVTGPQHPSRLHQEVINRLLRVRRKEQQISLLNGVILCTFVGLLVLLNAVAIERAFSPDTVGRTVLFVVSCLVYAGIVAWYVARPLLHVAGILPSQTLHELASIVGNHFPHIRDRLLNALQVVESKDQLQVLYSPELIDAAFEDLYREVRTVDFLESIDNGALRRVRRLAAYAGGTFLIVFVLSPSGFLNSVYRIWNFDQTFAATLPVHFNVEPGNLEVIRGTTVPLGVHVTGKPLSKLLLKTRQHSQVGFETRELQAIAKKGFEATFRDSLPSIKATTEYYVEAEEIPSDRFTITVVDRPLIRSFQVRLQYPGYTRLPPKVQEENIGDVAALPGTIVSVDIISSKELSAAALMFSDKTESPMSAEGTGSRVRFSLKKEGSYHVVLRDKEGLTNADPIEHSLKLVPDAFPTVSVLVPGKNVDVTEQMHLDLLTRMRDDFGFSKLRLAYRLAQSRYERPAENFSFLEIPLPSRDQATQELWYRWNLSGLDLVPEDIVAYYVEVFDNDVVSGPKAARSETYLLRLPSLDEVFQDVTQSQARSLESLQSAHENLLQIKKEMDELRNDLKSIREKADWQQEKKAHEMHKQFEELRKKLEETAQRLEENIQRMQENKLLSHETLEKFLELQKLMQELNAPELQKALKRLQEAMKQLSPDQVREAMQKLQLTEELFRKSLERTIELLKRVAIEQKLDELVQRAEQLIREQESLREQTAQADRSDTKRLEELSRRQQDLQEQLEAIERELSDLRKKMEEFPSEMPLTEMEKARQQLDQEQLGGQMQSAAQRIQSGEMQEAQRNQQRISQGLQRFMEQMQAAQKSMRENQQRQVLNEMRRALQNMLELSRRQEDLKDESRGLDPNSSQFRENAQEQMEVLGDLANITSSLTQLSRKTFAVNPEMGREIGRAMQNMTQAMRWMEQRNPGGAAQAQMEAMASLNRTAMMLQGAMDAMQGSGGMGMAGLMEQLQRMSGMQAGINAETQSMMGQGQLSAEQAAEWSRLAGEQGAVRKSLEELAKEADRTGEISKLLGDLNRIADEMREVQTDMEQDDVNPETIRKQERILSRLLDSQRSMRERDYEKRRRSETGKNIVRRSPGEIDLTTQEGRSRLRQELLKVLEQRYAKDYEDLIRRYFEALEKEDAPQ